MACPEREAAAPVGSLQSLLHSGWDGEFGGSMHEDSRALNLKLMAQGRDLAECVFLARAQRGWIWRARLIAMICLANLGLMGLRAGAQDRVGPQHPQRTVVDSTVLTPKQENAAKPGSEFKECANGCPVMIVVPAGAFIMGSPKNEADRRPTEGPQHEVTLAAPFAVSKFEVTFEEWDACTAEAACPRAPDRWGRGKMPVINVSWLDAKQYVAWLAQSTDNEYRLLTEAEWEYAARAGTHTRYSWGDDPGGGRANCNGCGSQSDLLQTAPAGSFKPNAFGLYDMHGNVWEWVEDSWHDNYDRAPTDGSAWIASGEPIFRGARGGSWNNEPELVRAATRVKRHVKVRFETLGFRVARTIKP